MLFPTLARVSYLKEVVCRSLGQGTEAPARGAATMMFISRLTGSVVGSAGGRGYAGYEAGRGLERAVDEVVLARSPERLI